MNRKSLLIVAAGLLLGSAAVLFVSMQGKTDQFPAYTEADLAKARSKMGYTAPPSVQTQQAIDPSRRLRLGIGSMGLGEERDRNVSDLMVAQLSTAPSLEMVERQELEAVLKELQLSLSGLVRAGDAVRVGKLLRADWFLLGTPAVVNGTNVTVIRAVDARTGIMRNATMVPQTKNEEQLALEIAAFIRDTRQEAATPKQRTYLAIGTFQDLSVNNRQATLPRDLRSQLIAAYQGSGVTMLEREFVSALLKELYLDLAGLTEEGETNAPDMQSAYWLVDGAYQSYERSQFEVELVLNVRRMFGRTQRFELREKPGDPLFRRVKETISSSMAQDNSGLILSRMSEFKAQMFAAQELIESVENATYGRMRWTRYLSGPSDEIARQSRNAEEAIRAVETALLLDPSNRRAKCLLARCLSTSFVGRFDEARDLYREVVDNPDADQWTGEAKKELTLKFSWAGGPSERQVWFESAAKRSNESARDFFQEQAKLAAEEVALQKTGTPEAERMAEERLFRDIVKWEGDLNDGCYSLGFDNTGLGKYAAAFGTNKALAASKLVSLLPRLQKVSTNLAPHILAGVVTFQVDTNAPVIAELERSLDSLSPQSGIFEEEYYRRLLYRPVYRWAEKKGLYLLAAKLKGTLLNYEVVKFGPEDEDRMDLAYSLLRAERWQEALDIFQSYSNQPVMMGKSGLWGAALTVVHPSTQTALCRQKLGLPVETDPREFALEKPCFHACSSDAYYNKLSFVASSENLWVSLKDEVTHLGFDLRTNAVIHVTDGDAAPINALCDGGSNIWAGTDGGGLFAVEKKTRRIRNFSERDGLLMNRISNLHLTGDTLWIAYGDEARGAVGCLDVPSGRFISFAPSLSKKPETNQPPAGYIRRVHGVNSDEVLCLVASTLLRCKPAEDRWVPISSFGATTCYNLDYPNVFQGISFHQVSVTINPISKVRGATNQSATTPMVMTQRDAKLLREDLKKNGSEYRMSESYAGLLPVGELETYSLVDGKRRRLLGGQRLPGPATALALNGRDLWVGGMGFLALIDLDQDKIVKLAYIQARQVDSIQFGGGWVWVQFNKHIYRIPENLGAR